MGFRFSGHESFTCRYPWLPKAYLAIQKDPNIFSDDNAAMVQLGVGKNMVRSIKFWIQVFGIAGIIGNGAGLKPTILGHRLFGPAGFDPYLDDVSTLWLLHWKISSIKDDPLFAWYFLLNNWPDPGFAKSAILNEFTKEADRLNKQLSEFTKDQHLDIFLHTYMPVRGRKAGEVLEDTLDSPFTELRFIQPAGEAIGKDGKKEIMYEFRRDMKPDISDDMFIYCVFDFWKRHRPQESTLSFRDLSVTTSSLGNVFKINEPDLRVRVEHLPKESKSIFEYVSSASLPRLIRKCELDEATEIKLLENIYHKKVQPRTKKVAAVKA